MKECPKCKKKTLEDEDVLNCLSKEDGETYICQECGNAEDNAGLKRKID